MVDSELQNPGFIIRVVGRDKQYMVYKEPIPANTTVGQFKTKLCEDSEILKKKRIGPQRIMLSFMADDGKTKVYLKDKTQPLSEYIAKSEITLDLKDLGP